MRVLSSLGLSAAFCLAALSPALAQQQTADTSEASSHAPQEPLWELRIGASALQSPDYPGAKDQSLNWVAAPILIYRGEKIRFGDFSVARAIATETKRFELDLSADAVYSANSDDGVREGMPDLDYLLQIGPQAVVNFHDTGWTADGRKQLKLLMPVRGVAATDFSAIDHAGWIAEPQLVYRRQYGSRLRQSWSATLFATFADADLAGYWYDVAPEYATVERPAYAAESGYVASGMRLSWTRELTDRFQVFLTWQGRSLSGAANADSPLLNEDFTQAASVSFVWKAAMSKRPARNDDM